MSADEWRIALVGLVAGLCTVLVVDQAAALSARPDPSPPAVVAGATLQRDPSPEMVARLTAATVLVHAQDCGALNGTGVMLRSGLVLTNRHVLDGATSFSYETSDGALQDAGHATTPLAGDVAAGAAPDAASRDGLDLAADDPAIGDMVALAGHAGGGPLRVRTASVLSTIVGSGPLDPPAVVRLDVIAVPGDSGSPVMDASGRLVGLVYAAEHGSRTALMIPVSELRRALLTMEPAEQTC